MSGIGKPLAFHSAHSSLGKTMPASRTNKCALGPTSRRLASSTSYTQRIWTHGSRHDLNDFPQRALAAGDTARQPTAKRWTTCPPSCQGHNKLLVPNGRSPLAPESCAWGKSASPPPASLSNVSSSSVVPASVLPQLASGGLGGLGVRARRLAALLPPHPSEQCFPRSLCLKPRGFI